MLTLSGFIKAGDNHAYSSSMFDWIPQSNEEVSWKPLYQSFFNELVWMRKEQSTAPSRDISRLIVTARKHMKISKRGAAIQKHSPQLRFVVLRALTRVVGSINRVKNETEGAERHTLYQEGYTRETQLLKSRNSSDLSEKGLNFTGPRKAAPKLVKNFKKLRPLDLNSSDDTNGRAIYLESTWAGDLRKVSVRQGQPYIEVAAEELAALSFVLGIPIALGDSSESTDLESFGAFGISLRSHRSPDGVHHLRFDYRQRDILQQPSKGSGYSTIFAKNLACGSLPFAQDDNATHTIFVNQAAVKSLRRGLSTANATVNVLTPQTEYLSRLPSSTA